MTTRRDDDAATIDRMVEFSDYRYSGTLSPLAERFNLPNGYKFLETLSPNHLTLLVHVTLPESLQAIGDGVFEGCTALEYLSIPNSVTTIGKRAFARSGLVSIVLPPKLTIIQDELFKDCKVLETVIMDDKITFIGYHAFYKCVLLTLINLSSVLESMGDGVFCKCESLQSIIMPDTVNKLGDATFKDCTSLIEVQLSKLITTIPMNTFADCRQMAVVPNLSNVVSIETGAFAGCSNLRTRIVFSNPMIISSRAFKRCTNLREVVFMENSEIHSMAFANCIKLNKIIANGYKPLPLTSDGGLLIYTDEEAQSKYGMSLEEVHTPVSNPNITIKGYSPHRPTNTFANNSLITIVDMPWTVMFDEMFTSMYPLWAIIIPGKRDSIEDYKMFTMTVYRCRVLRKRHYQRADILENISDYVTEAMINYGVVETLEKYMIVPGDAKIYVRNDFYNETLSQLDW